MYNNRLDEESIDGQKYRSVIIESFSKLDLSQQIKDYNAYKAMGDNSPLNDAAYKFMESIISAHEDMLFEASAIKEVNDISDAEMDLLQIIFGMIFKNIDAELDDKAKKIKKVL